MYLHCKDCKQRPLEFRRCSCRKPACRPNSVHGADQGWSLLEEEVLLEEGVLLEGEVLQEEEVLLEEVAEDSRGGTGTGEMRKTEDKEVVQTV